MAPHIEHHQEKKMTAREAWIAGAIWALMDQGNEITVYVREIVEINCPLD